MRGAHRHGGSAQDQSRCRKGSPERRVGQTAHPGGDMGLWGVTED